MAFTATVSGRRVACGPDQSVLDAFLRAGAWMPNSCNQGTCGTCKVRVLSGEVDHRDSPLGTLTEDERAAGLALACQARLRRCFNRFFALSPTTGAHPCCTGV